MLTSLCVNSWRSDIGCSKEWVKVASGVFMVVVGMFCPLRSLSGHRTHWGQILSLDFGCQFLDQGTGSYPRPLFLLLAFTV